MNINPAIFWASILLILASYAALGVYAIRTAEKLRRRMAECDAERLKGLLARYENITNDPESVTSPLLGVIYSISEPKEHRHND
jgi:hypothetical protein